jgi:hypothetical protein
MDTFFVVLVLFSCLALSSSSAAAVNSSSLFWSYYSSPGAVQRASISQGGYDRSSPAHWSGPALQRNAAETSSNDDVLQLGQFLKLSHGPRRRRRQAASNNITVTLPGPAALLLGERGTLPQFRRYETPHAVGAGVNGGFVWPLKYSQARAGGLPGPPEDPAPTPVETPPRPLPPPTTALQRSSPAGPALLCRHYCVGDPSGTPCCQPVYPFHTIGPLVQPTLLENWVSGVLEFGAQNPVVFALGKSLAVIGLLAIVLVVWALLGEWLGFAEIPRARISFPAAAIDASVNVDDPAADNSLERFVVEVAEGHWLKALEEHVAGSSLAQEVSSFLCCVYPGAARLECLPRARAGSRPPAQGEDEEDQLTCLTNRIYDIALNLKTLKAQKKKKRS